MRKYVLLFLLLTFTLSQLSAQSGKISREDRSFLVDFLTVTQQDLLQTISDLSETEWLTKPSDGGWSPAECMEHIVEAEKAVFKQVKKALDGPSGTDDLSARDGWLMCKVVDRGTKVKTPLPPSSAAPSKVKLVEAFKASRKEIFRFLADKKLPLRTHYGKSPYGKADAYQLLLVIAGHSMRHTNQILETVAIVN
ncbi:MAG: DinB family protein [Saprospiraceae bacterium]|nr:DinB family protein [Saprospiraceae bacterium]